VLTVKYGRLLEELFTRPGGTELRRRIDDMPNSEYQRLLRCTPAQLGDRLPGPDASDELRQFVAGLEDDTLLAAIRNLGGHDMRAVGDAFAAIDDTRPTVIFAYTVKGYGLPSEGHPQNHSALLNVEQMRDLAERSGVSLDSPWQRFEATTPAGELCEATARRLAREPVQDHQVAALPIDFGRTPTGTATTQAALGRALLDLTRSAPDAASRVVTLCPDVASSTNLGGWVNKVGVWSAAERQDWFSDDPETILHWRESPKGQHLELGIAEGNLVGLLGELGATWSRWGQPLLPIGVLYDPFVERALEPWSYGIYAGGQSILVGTPSGVTLAPEGGAHQSITTPSVGLEQPGCITYEPAFAVDVEWTLLASLARLGRPDGTSAYLRLSTRPVDQRLADVPRDAAARERRRSHVVGGAYVLRRSFGDVPAVTIVSMGAVTVEALHAADRLESLSTPVDVICVTSPGLLFDAVQGRAGHVTRSAHPETWILDAVFPARRAAPMVTVLDGHPHTLAFLAGINQVRGTHLGVTRFGQSGDLESVYRHHGLDADSIVASALDVL
jgi:pyruvate dehydrogenase E1 component